MTLLDLIKNLQKEDDWTIEVNNDNKILSIGMYDDDYSFLTPQVVVLLLKEVIINAIFKSGTIELTIVK